MDPRSFQKRHRTSLGELLMSPLIFREALPGLESAPRPSAAGLKDLAAFAGFRAPAARTALSRLRRSGLVQVAVDGAGVERYRRGAFASSVQHAVAGQLERPSGFTIAIFSFAAEQVRERQMVREALRLHGFQKLAQNAYLSGRVDTAALEAHLAEAGVGDHVYFFPAESSGDPVLRRKLLAMFDLKERAAALLELHAELTALLDDRRLDDLSFARRLLLAGPVHYRVTFVDEPPLPADVLPPGYPLDDVVGLITRLVARRPRALHRYFSEVHT